MKHAIYLDDIRTPANNIYDWVVVRNYTEFVNKITELGLENIELISLDHDLGEAAMADYFLNQYEGEMKIDYEKIAAANEKTGMDCAKWLVEKWMDNPELACQVSVHSANEVGSLNMMSLLNSFYKSYGLTQYKSAHWIPKFTMETIISKDDTTE